MCGSIFNTYRSCGHRLDSGEVEPCEDGILSGKTCKGPDSKPPGDVFDQVVHTQCPPCEEAQKELDDDLDSPLSSWVSEQRSQTPKKAHKQTMPQPASVGQASSRRSGRTAFQPIAPSMRTSITKTQSVVTNMSGQESRLTSKLSARKAGKQPVYPQQSSSVATFSRASSINSGLSKSSSRAGLSQIAPQSAQRNVQQAMSSTGAAGTSQSTISSRSGSDSDDTIKQQPQSPLVDEQMLKSVASSRSRRSRSTQKESALSSNYASTIRKARSSHASSRASSRKTRSTRKSSRSRNSQRQGSLVPSNMTEQESRQRGSPPITTSEMMPAPSHGPSEQFLRPPASTASGSRSRRSQADHHLRSARDDLHQILASRAGSPSARSGSLRSRVSGLFRGGIRAGAQEIAGNSQAGLSGIDERSEATSISRPTTKLTTDPSEAQSRGLAVAPTQATEYAPVAPQPQAPSATRDRLRDPSYVHPNSNPSRFPSRRSRGRSSASSEQAEDSHKALSARLLAEEMAKAKELDGRIATAREELRQVEDMAFERDTRQAILKSQDMSPHEQWQESNLLRQALHASLQHQRDTIQRDAAGEPQTVQVVYARCGHRLPKDAAHYIDPGKPVPRFFHQQGLCEACQHAQDQTAGASSQTGPSGAASRAVPAIQVVEPSSAAPSRRSRGQRQRYEPTESPTMTSSERAEVCRPPPSFASSRRREEPRQRDPSVTPSAGVPVDVAYRMQDREEASRRRLFEKKNREYQEYQRVHPNSTDSEDDE